MKLNRLIVASVLGLTLSASPSAFACEHGNGWLFSMFHHCDENKRDDDNRDRGRGNGNSRGGGRDNDGGRQCGRGGSNSGGGSSSGGGSTGGGAPSDPIYK